MTAVEIREKHTADVTLLPALVENTNEGFEMKEVSADKAYLSADSVAAVRKVGATPFIAFKRNSTDRGVVGTSVATPKPAMYGHFKTGHMKRRPDRVFYTFNLR